jgi:hypothetical protein
MAMNVSEKIFIKTSFFFSSYRKDTDKRSNTEEVREEY